MDEGIRFPARSRQRGKSNEGGGGENGVRGRKRCQNGAECVVNVFDSDNACARAPLISCVNSISRACSISWSHGRACLETPVAYPHACRNVSRDVKSMIVWARFDLCLRQLPGCRPKSFVSPRSQTGSPRGWGRASFPFPLKIAEIRGRKCEIRYGTN